MAENFLQVHIDDLQFGFMSGRSTTDAIFIVRQLQEKFHAINKALYMTFVDLEKKYSILYTDVSSGRHSASLALRSGWCGSYRACMGEEFRLKVDVQCGSCLSPLLFITVLEVLS